MSDNLNVRVITGRVRLSYANIWKPRKSEDSDALRYSVCLLIPKTDKKTIRAIKEATQNAITIGHAKLANKSGKLPSSIKTPLKNGDDKDQEEYHGHYYINCSSTNKPGIVDRNREQITDPDLVYSGCYARVSINLGAYVYGNGTSKGITAYLNNIQFVADGPRLAGGPSAEEEFDDDFDDFEDDDYEEETPTKSKASKKPTKHKPVDFEEDDDDEDDI